MKYLGPKNEGDDLATQSDVTGGGAPLTNTTPDAITPDQAGAVGTSSEAARADHAHEINAAAPSANLTATTTNAEGSSTSFSRADHSHALTTGAPTSNLTASTTNAAGTSASLARADHSHAITTGTPGTISPDDTAATGTSADLARADHRHAITAAAPSSNLTAATTNAEGTASSFARSDHLHAITVGSGGTITGTNASGSSPSLARADHDHALGTNAVTSAALGLTMAKATRTSAQSFASSTSFVDVTFPTEDFDHGDLHPPSTNTDRITVNATGIWLVQAGAGFAANSTGWRAIVISIDATDQAETTVRVGAAAAATRITTSGIFSLTSGQVLRLGAAQNSGSTLNLDAAFLSAVRLR